MVDEGSAAAEAAALRRKRVLERGKDRLKSITVGGRKEEDLQQQPAAAATTAIESKEAATATTTTATTEAAPLPPPPLPTTTTTTTAARGAAAVLDRARTEITPSPRGASRSRNGGATAGGRGASAATTAAAAAEQTTQLLFARRAAAATAEDVALAALRASSPSRLLLAAAAPMLLPTLSKFLGGFAGEDSGGSFQLLLSPLVTALASLCASRPLLLLLTLQAWLVATASALLVSRPSALGASLEDSPTPAGALRSLAKLAGLARGEEAARRLRWVAVAADAAGAARDACAVYLVSAVTVAYYHSFKLAREMDALAAAAAAAEGSSAVEVRGKKKNVTSKHNCEKKKRKTMVAATLPRSLSLRAAAVARGYRRSVSSGTFAVSAAASMSSSDSALRAAAEAARARAPSACWSSEDRVPAILAPPPPPPPSAAASSDLPPLSGLTFAIKEMYDVVGQEPAFGSPAYRRWRIKIASSDSSSASPTSTSTAPAVAALVAAGATLIGRTNMSEIAYSFTGEHSFYPVPPNPAFENDDPSSPRLCGGSSSGSACAVSSGAVDFALGSDTGGSVRIPASYCGIFGFRPTHGAVPMQGAQALAPSFDTAGWFAKDAETLRDVGKVLLLQGAGGGGGGGGGEKRKPFNLRRWLVAADAFDRARPEVSGAIFEAVARSKSAIEELLAAPSEVQLWDPRAGGSGGARDAFRFAQAAEALRPEALGAFLEAHPELGPVARERVEWARTVTAEQEAEALKARATFSSRLDGILRDDAVIALPAAPNTAPLAGSGADEGPSRGVLLELTAAAGLASLPQIVFPVAVVAPATVTGGGGPVALSLIGPRGSDLELLELGVRLSRAMGL